MVENRVRRYMVRVLKTYHKTFYGNMCKLWPDILGMYVWDEAYYRVKGINFTPYLFIELKVGGNSDIIKEVIRSSHVVDNYVTDKGLVLVIRVEPEWLKSYASFLRGEYSKMFAPSDLKRVGLTPVSEGKPNVIYGILFRNEVGLKAFHRIVTETFGVSLSTGEIMNSPEYDLPLCGEDVRGDFNKFKQMLDDTTGNY